MASSPDSRRSAAAALVARRDLLRLLALSPLGLALTRPAAADPLPLPNSHEPTAGRWQPWLMPSSSAFRPAAPPSADSSVARTELAELAELQARRSDASQAVAAFWDPQGGVTRWSQLLLDKIKENKVNPVRAARALALFHVALADATIATWDAKFTYDRPNPSRLSAQVRPVVPADESLPTYPSEHAAVAAAAASMLNWLFPGQTGLLHGQAMSFDALANEAALSRLWAGANYRSDLEAGVRLGQEAAKLAVARGMSDGSGAVWDAQRQPGRLRGPQYWEPTPPGFVSAPLEPLAATWKPWLLASPNQFRPGPPPGLETPFPSPRFLAEVNEVKQTVDTLNDMQRAIALFWADNPGESYTPPGHWAQIAAEQIVANRLSAPRAARALALVGVGLADSAIACWDCKFTYWLLRPVTAIRTLSGQPFHDPNWVTLIGTPPFPTYTSGHSTFSGCSAAVLEHLFPGGQVKNAQGWPVSFAEAAAQAAVSRLYGGIHYRSDNEEGLVCGRKVAETVIHRAQIDGAY